MSISHDKLFARIKSVALYLENAAAYVQNDLQRLLDDGHTTLEAISEARDAQQQMFKEVKTRVDEISSECLEYHKQFVLRGFRVRLTYFNPSGTFYSTGEYFSLRKAPSDIWSEVWLMRDQQHLPGLSPSLDGISTVKYDVLVEVPDHPDTQLKLIRAI